MALLDDINLLLRDHTGYTGDGQGGSGPLPVGDRSTARFPINKRDLRELLIGIAQTMGDPSALDEILEQLDEKASLSALNRLGLIPLTNVGGTANAITASIPAALASDGVALNANSTVSFTPSSSNTGSPVTLFVAGDQARTLRGEDGGDIPVGYLKASRFYIAQRFGLHWKIISGGATFDDLTTIANALNVVGVTPLINVAGTGNAITADMAANAVSAGMVIGGNALVEFIPVATNTSPSPTLNVSQDGTARLIQPEDGGSMPAEFLVPGRSYLLRRRGSVWRVVAGGATFDDLTTKADQTALDALADDVATKADQTALDDEAQAREAGDDLNAQAIADEATARSAAIAAAVDKVDLADSERPGEDKSRWSVESTGDPASRPPLSVGTVAVGFGGAALRLTGADIPDAPGYLDVAPRKAYSLDVGRVYELRVGVSRIANSSDPSGDSIEVRAQNLNGNKSSVSNVTLIPSISPVVADGLVEMSATISRTDATADYNPPATTRYFTPIIRVHGVGHTTEIVYAHWEDITDAAIAQDEAGNATQAVAALSSVVATKADQTALDALSSDVATKADQTALDALDAAKADQTALDAETAARQADVAEITERLIVGGDIGDVVPVVETTDGNPVIGVDVTTGEAHLHLSPSVEQAEIPVSTLRLVGRSGLGDDESIIEDRDGNRLGVIRNGRLVVPQPGKSDGVSYESLPLRTNGGLGDDDVLVVGDDGKPLLTNRNGRLVAEIEPYIPSVPDVGHDAWGWTWRNGAWGFTGNLWGDGPRGYRTDGSLIWADSNRANIVLFVGSDLRENGSGDVPYHAFGPDYAPVSDGQCAAFCEAEALWRIAQRQSPPLNMVVEQYSATLGDMLSNGYQQKLAQLTDTARREGVALGYAPTASYAILSHSFDTGADYTARFEQLVAKLEHQYGVGRVIWTQFAGTKSDGTMPEILHQEAVTAGVCATPLYPFEVEPLTGVNLTDDAARLVAEHEALAAITVDWRLPRLITAMLEGSKIRVKFDCAEGLVLDEYTTMTHHGFALDGVTNGATITGVSIGGPLPGEDVLITLSAPPTGDLVLRYAYGLPASSDDYPANRGALRANWTAPSKLVPGALLKKFAPAFQIEVV